MFSIETMRLDVEQRMRRGERFTDVEDVINASDLATEEKSALWLLAWSYVHPKAQRRDHRTPRRPDARDVTAGHQPQAASPYRRVNGGLATAFTIVASVDWTRGSPGQRRCAGARLDGLGTACRSNHTHALLHSPGRSGFGEGDALLLMPPS